MCAVDMLPLLLLKFGRSRSIRKCLAGNVAGASILAQNLGRSDISWKTSNILIDKKIGPVANFLNGEANWQSFTSKHVVVVVGGKARQNQVTVTVEAAKPAAGKACARATTACRILTKPDCRDSECRRRYLKVTKLTTHAYRILCRPPLLTWTVHLDREGN